MSVECVYSMLYILKVEQYNSSQYEYNGNKKMHVSVAKFQCLDDVRDGRQMQRQSTQ